MDKIMKFLCYDQVKTLVKALHDKGASAYEMKDALESIREFPTWKVKLDVDTVSGSPKKVQSQGNSALADANAQPRKNTARGNRLRVSADGTTESIDVVTVVTAPHF